MTTLKERLDGQIPKDKMAQVKGSFDVIGDIAVLEIPDEIKKYEKKIAEAVVELYPRIKVVAKKIGATSGVERVRPVKVIAGEKRTETVYIENGCRYKLDINKVYFSPRLGSERLRVAEQVKKKEVVYDLFCGVGPYAIPCAKRGKKVVAVDINKNAVYYTKENMKLNKVENAEAYSGSCRIMKKKEHKGKADRVIMNHPSGAQEFLDVAFYVAKKGAKVHYYTFTPEEEIYKAGVGAIRAAAAKAKKNVRIVEKKKCGQYAPRVWRVCIDFKIN